MPARGARSVAITLVLLGAIALPAATALAAGAPGSAGASPVRKGPWTELPPIAAPGFVNPANDKPLVAARPGLSVLAWRDSDHAASGGYGNLWSWIQTGGKGGWRSRTKLSAHASEHALFRLAAGPTGTIVICWLDKTGASTEEIRMRVIRRSSSHWSRAIEVARIEPTHPLAEGVHDLRVSVGRSGATVAWLLGGGGLQARVFRLHGGLGPTEPISTEAEAVEFHLAATPTGETIAALGTWGTQYAVAASPSPGVPFGSTRSLSSIPEVEGATFFLPSYGNEIAANRDGAVVAVWSIYLSSSANPGTNMLYADVRPAGSTEWLAPVVLSSNADANFDFEAQVKADAAGRFRVLAATDPSPTGRELTLFTSDPGATSWRPRVLEPALGLNDAFRLAAGARGEAAVLYERGIGPRTTSRLYARATTRGGRRWGRPVLLDRASYRSSAGTGTTPTGGTSGPALTVTPGGGVLAAWIDNSTIRSAVKLAPRG